MATNNHPRDGERTAPPKDADLRARRAETHATRSFFVAGALAWGTVVAVVACEDGPTLPGEPAAAVGAQQTTVDPLPVVGLERAGEEDGPGIGGGADAGMMRADAGRVIRPSTGPYTMNVDGGAAGMNAQGEVHAVPAAREGGLGNVALDAGTKILPGSKRPTK